MKVEVEETVGLLAWAGHVHVHGHGQIRVVLFRRWGHRSDGIGLWGMYEPWFEAVRCFASENIRSRLKYTGGRGTAAIRSSFTTNPNRQTVRVLAQDDFKGVNVMRDFNHNFDTDLLP